MRQFRKIGGNCVATSKTHSFKGIGQMQIWKFETANFSVVMSAEDEPDLDISWDDDGSVKAGLESGEFVSFCAKCTVYFRGSEIASDYLGNCIYRTPEEFRDHIGLAAKSRADGCVYGSYFADMVKNAISEARKTLRDMPRMRATA